MAENKVSKEVAEAEFQKFIDLMDIDANPELMDEDDAKGFTTNKDRFIRGVMRGKVSVNENGEPELRTSRTENVEKLVFFEPSAATLMAMDRKKSGQSMAKMLSLMDDLTKSPAGTCSKLVGDDYKIAMAVTTIFLA